MENFILFQFQISLIKEHGPNEHPLYSLAYIRAWKSCSSCDGCSANWFNEAGGEWKIARYLVLI